MLPLQVCGGSSVLSGCRPGQGRALPSRRARQGWRPSEGSTEVQGCKEPHALQAVIVQAYHHKRGQPGEDRRAHACSACSHDFRSLGQLQAAGSRGKTLEAAQRALRAEADISTKAFKEAVS